MPMNGRQKQHRLFARFETLRCRALTSLILLLADGISDSQAISRHQQAARVLSVHLMGSRIIINSAIIGGKISPPMPDADGNIAYAFIQPPMPCGAPKCEQEILRLNGDPLACWIYEDIRIDNVDAAYIQFGPDERTPGVFRVLGIGDVSGCIFLFRAHVIPRCGPAQVSSDTTYGSY